MSEMNLCRRNLLKAGAAAAAGIMASAAANAGIPAAKVEKYDEEYDVVIIGSGFAGMACALKAGRAGKKVLMLEKMPVVGGNSAICGGNVACPVNPVQKAQGIKDSRELFIADCLKDVSASTTLNCSRRSLTAATTRSSLSRTAAPNSCPTTCSSKAATPFRVPMKLRPAPALATSTRCTTRSRSSATSR